MHICIRPFPRSLCKCCGCFKYTEKTLVFNKLRMDIICVVCKPHYLSVASVQGYHTCYYICMTLGGAITLDLTCRPGLCIIQWKYIILNGRCWMTFAFICNYADAFLPERNTRKDYSFFFIRPKRICVCQSQAERVWLILVTVLQRQRGFKGLFHNVWSFTCFIYFQQFLCNPLFPCDLSPATCWKVPCLVVCTWHIDMSGWESLTVLFNLFGRTSLSDWWLWVSLCVTEEGNKYDQMSNNGCCV